MAIALINLVSEVPFIICYIYNTKLYKVAGIIYLIPVTLGGSDYQLVLPEKVTDLTRSLRHFVVEDLRSARRFLRLIDKNFPIDESVFYELNEHTRDSEIDFILDPVIKGSDIGLMSEAGLPGIADPGSRLIESAHRWNIRVVPLSGPSSIIMALISSGMNGQSFVFHGYLPVKAEVRTIKLKEIEKKSQLGDTQIFMETPYRNQKMIESILFVCHPDTKLCVAADLTLPSEFIKTKRISEWRKNIPVLNDRLVIFLIGN
jgi:16S rRNA (cytidine1402-2'-O)-methyltransferase